MRMNISVPDDLRTRMDRCEGVNWSALACRAFSEAVIRQEAERQRKKGKPHMKTVIERLRLSQQQQAERAASKGEIAGYEWAQKDAEAEHLRRLEMLCCGSQDWSFGNGSENSNYSAAQLFYFIIEPDDNKDREAAREFWANTGHETAAEDPEYVDAFARGAFKLWEEVKSEL